jgi:hypothetical protein
LALLQGSGSLSLSDALNEQLEKDGRESNLKTPVGAGEPSEDLLISVVPESETFSREQTVTLARLLFRHRDLESPMLAAAAAEAAARDAGLGSEVVAEWFANSVTAKIHIKFRQQQQQSTQPLQKKFNFPRSHSTEVVNILKTYLVEKRDPFPPLPDVNMLAASTGLTTKQVRAWFGSARMRNLLDKLVASNWSPEPEFPATDPEETKDYPHRFRNPSNDSYNLNENIEASLRWLT